MSLKLSDQRGRMAIMALVVIALVVFISFISNKLQQEVTQIESDRKQVPIKAAIVPQPSTQPPKTNLTGQVTRKTMVVRGNDMMEHWFYQDGQIIAKQHVSNAGVIDTEGTMPEGKVKFEDSYKQTFGEEFYKDGVRNGYSTTYYKTGELKERAFYSKGMLVTKTEFYTDGRPRFEVDYSDSRNLEDKTEVGVGKLYWSNGFLKYEWNLTNRDPIGFKKSYNQDGALRHAVYFDEYNNIVER